MFYNIYMLTLGIVVILSFFFHRHGEDECHTFFLVADTQLCERLCPSIRPYIHLSVRPFVRRPSACCSTMLDIVCVCTSVKEGVWEWVWSEAGGLMLIATRLQRYCDPASLASFFLHCQGVDE